MRERRYVEVDAFTLVDVALTIERQVQAVPGEQDMGQQLGIANLAEFQRAMRALPDEAVFALNIRRGNMTLFVTVP